MLLCTAPQCFYGLHLVNIWHLSREWRWEATWFCNIIKLIKGGGGNLIQFWLIHDHEYERLHKCSSWYGGWDHILIGHHVGCTVILFSLITICGGFDHQSYHMEDLIIFSLIDDLNLTSYGGYGHLWSLHGHLRLQTFSWSFGGENSTLIAKWAYIHYGSRKSSQKGWARSCNENLSGPMDLSASLWYRQNLCWAIVSK